MRVDYLKIRVRCECKKDVFILSENNQDNNHCFTTMPVQCPECGNGFFVHIQEAKKP